MLHKAIQQLFTDVAWGELDYLIVDLPPGTGDAQLSLAQSVPLTGGVIVTSPQAVAVSDARRGASAFEHLEVPIIGVIENMAGEIFGSGGGEIAAEGMGLEFLGRVALDPEIRIGGDSGQPIVIAAAGERNRVGVPHVGPQDRGAYQHHEHGARSGTADHLAHSPTHLASLDGRGMLQTGADFH